MASAQDVACAPHVEAEEIDEEHGRRARGLDGLVTVEVSRRGVGVMWAALIPPCCPSR